jgi:hypothetical protein
VSVTAAKVLLVKIVIIQECLVQTFDFEDSISPCDEYPSFPLEIEDVEKESDKQSWWSFHNGPFPFYRHGSLSPIKEPDEDISDTQSTVDQDNDQGLQVVPYHNNDFGGLGYKEFDSDSDSESEYSEFRWNTKEVDDDSYPMSR